MGRSKELVYYNGCLKGSYLTDKDCEILDNIIRLNDENGCISDLKNVICDLNKEDVEFIKANKSSLFVEPRIGELEDRQTLGVAFMYFAQRMVLGDSVGLGKTVEICGLCNLITQEKLKDGCPFRFLYLTEKATMEQTRDELIRFTGEYVELVRGEKKYVTRFAEENESELLYSVIGPHSLINSVEFQEYLREYRVLYGCNPFDALFIDESAVVGNTATKTYDNAKKLAKDFDWVIVMNATAFETNLRVFYAQLNLCDDTFLPTKTRFQQLYEVKEYTGMKPYGEFRGKYKNAHMFKDQVKYRYFARTRKSIGAKMENCSARIKISELSSIQKNLLKKTSMPQMVYDCPSYFDYNIEMNGETTPKIRDLINTINGDFKDEASILVYSRYKESQRGIKEALELEGISCEIMNGDTSDDERSDIISKFKLGDFRVLVTNVQKGLNFGHCNACIFYTYDPNPNKMVQFEGRMTRSKDIIGKKVVLLMSSGKEYKRFLSVVADRAKASDLFAGSDFSCVLSLLLDSGELKGLSQ